ncbi:MAG: hypothetical protein ACLFN8_01275 [Candidatus Woesearchaeota archaeon]
MNLEDRVLDEFYPVDCNLTNTLKIGQHHNVRSLGFEKAGSFTCPDYYFSIQSPSVKEFRQRKYLLNYNRNGANKTNKIIYGTFSGLMGESIMRITIKEFFRRISKKLKIDESNFIKTEKKVNNNTETKQKENIEINDALTLDEITNNQIIIKENERYILEGISRYNQILIDKNCPKQRNITEYDGLFEYKTRKVDGLIICESKIGTLGYLRSTEKNNKKIYRKIIEPIKSLYPEKQIDFLIMGTREEITIPTRKYKPLREGLVRLNSYLNEHDIGLIPMILPVKRQEIDNIAQTILGFNKLEKAKIQKVPQENKYLINYETGELLIITGKRIDLILNLRSDPIKRVYDSGKLKYKTTDSTFLKDALTS